MSNLVKPPHGNIKSHSTNFNERAHVPASQGALRDSGCQWETLCAKGCPLSLAEHPGSATHAPARFFFLFFGGGGGGTHLCVFVFFLVVFSFGFFFQGSRPRAPKKTQKKTRKRAGACEPGCSGQPFAQRVVQRPFSA